MSTESENTEIENEPERTEEEIEAAAEESLRKAATTATADEPDDKEDKADEEGKEDEAEEDSVLEILQKDFKWKPTSDNGYDELKRLVEAARKVGERDEDAVFARQVRQALEGREEEFQEFLTTPRVPAKHAEPASDDIPTYEEYQLLQLRASAENASAKDKNAFAEAQAAIAKRNFELIRNPSAAAKAEIEKLRAELNEVKQASTQTQRQGEFQRALESDKALLHVDGDFTKPMLPFGEKVFAEFQELVDDGMDLAKAYRRAVKYVKSAAPPVTQPRKVVGARRSPAVASPPAEDGDRAPSAKRKDGSLKTEEDLAEEMVAYLVKKATKPR